MTGGENPAEGDGLTEEITVSEINYVYIESPYLETPETQRIVFSFESAIPAEAVALVVEDEAGNQEEWQLARQADNLYLFEKEFSGDAYTGTYHAVSLKAYNGENVEEVLLADRNVTAEFGVNQEYDGIEELRPVEEGTEEEALVESSIVTIDENGVTEAQDSISDALNAAGIEAASSGTTSFRSRSASPSARSGNIVVALDPGHDSSHAGAQAGGLQEEVLTLKIANYCKQELEQYSGVTVYMTRTDASCPNPGSTSSGDDIGRRVNAAADAGAQIFVSFHLNSSTSSAANGAEIIIPNQSWKPDVAADGNALAREILDELVALGLGERSIYSKDTTVGETYDDGSISDYFAVQIYSKERGIPGIIVEHAFMSNSSDVNNFLNSETGLKKLGVADATGIAQYLGLSKGRWETDSKGNKYYYENGRKVTGGKQIGGYWYYFDPNKSGAMLVSDWRDKNGQKYYYDAQGHMLADQGMEYKGEWYYFTSSGAMLVSGWRNKNGQKYYYDDQGHMLSDKEEKISGFWYYFTSSGAALTSHWREKSGSRYYYDGEGHLVTNKGIAIGGYWYYFDGNGKMYKSQWREKSGVKYYYDGQGHLVTNKGLEIGGYWYYFDASGAMYKSQWREKNGVKYYYDGNGHLVTDRELEIDGNLYYFDASGAMYDAVLTTGWQEENGNTYYYDSNGNKVVNKGIAIDGYWYYFDASGVMYRSRWRDKAGDRYYYDGEGHLVTNKGIAVGDYWYYFDNSGAMYKSQWRDKAGVMYYYDGEGRLITNKGVAIGGYWYYFDNSGAMYRSQWRDKAGVMYYYDGEGHLITNKGVAIGGYWYYFDNSGAMYRSQWRDKAGVMYYYDGEGHLVTNSALEIDGQMYYFDASGAMYGQESVTSGWQEENGNRYYYSNGNKVVNKGIEIDGYWYYFGANGAMYRSQWRDKGGAKYYYDGEGHLITGKGVEIGGYWYYFDNSGAMYRSQWREKAGVKYYYDGKGHLVTNKGLQIGSYWYYFDNSGAMYRSQWRDKAGVMYYYDGEGHLVTGTTASIDGTVYDFDSSGAASAAYSIAGNSSVTVDAMVKYYENNSTIDYPSEALKKGGATTLRDFCQIYYEECAAEGIKAEVAFVQAMLETGFLKYGGDVKIEQFNFAGLGATGNGEPGNSFSDVRTGIRAHVQHLKCYANNEPLNNPRVDPRWSDSLRGKAAYVGWLSIKHNPNGTGWASDANYGTKLLTGIKKILNL